jgi:outer membrane biosynthesis protein TonB
MTEGLFILTALVVAYIIYVIINQNKADGAGSKPVAASKAVAEEKPKTAAAQAKPAAAKKSPAKPAAAKPAVETPMAAAKAVAAKPSPAPKPAPAAKPTVAKAAAVKPAETPAPAPEPAAIKGTGLKDPKTGEVVTAYSNYRFTKRWVKEALVAEKLVEKVYKNDELNADIEAKIKAGLAKLEGMKKYKA